MKIKVVHTTIDHVLCLPKAEHKKPRKPGLLFRTLVRLASLADLKDTHFSYTCDAKARELIRKKVPCLILMNHSGFIDLEMVSAIFYPRPYCIVCTCDGFVGKEGLMRRLGCIPTRKFVSDLTLIRDIQYALKELKTGVLMYPEASYSFDGCATPLPRGLGRFLKMLNVPVVMITTFGAFARDPLYNNLQKRKVDVRAEVSCLLSQEDVALRPVSELDDILDGAFCFDNFRWQADNGVCVEEPFRADGLERILYRCSSCGAEGHMVGKGTTITCLHCGKTHTLTPLGRLAAEDGAETFTHIPDWYAYERDTIRRELEEGTYLWDAEVDIGCMVDYKAIYMVGSGRLTHTKEGFTLTGCEGKLCYRQHPRASYGLYADYFWYEIGDVVCIGDGNILYYCFPKNGAPVARARLGAEELFKMSMKAREARKSQK